jgi:hypothetical protein
MGQHLSLHCYLSIRTGCSSFRPETRCCVFAAVLVCAPGRAAHFRARIGSGMRDAHDCQHKVPEGFSQSCMESLLTYLYTDTLPGHLEPPAVVELLHAASYYGTTRSGTLPDIQAHCSSNCCTPVTSAIWSHRGLCVHIGWCGGLHSCHFSLWIPQGLLTTSHNNLHTGPRVMVAQ